MITYRFYRCVRCRLTFDDRAAAAAHFASMPLTLDASGGISRFQDHRIRLHRVQGQLSEKKLCNEACTNAFHSDCECQCGGANHGRYSAAR